MPPPYFRPFRHLLYLLSPPCQVEVQCNPAKLISDNSSSENYDTAGLPVSSIWNNRLPRIIAPVLCKKDIIAPPGYYSRKYGIRICITLADTGEGPGGQASLIFRPNWDPKGRKNFVWRPGPPYLRVWIRQCIRKSVSSFLSGPRAHLWPFYEPISIRFLFSIMILKFLFLKPEN